MGTNRNIHSIKCNWRALLVVLVLLSCVEDTNGEPLNEPIHPLPQSIDLDPRKVRLGRHLFHEKQLSADNNISCATCHDLKRGGVDKLQVSIGINGAKGNINSPTVFNSGFNFRQFWNGRAESLEEQIEGPVNHPKEMGSNWAEVISRLDASGDYATRFRALYSNGITRENIKDAIATFERSLITPNAPFDLYLLGDEQAITEEAKSGYQLFKNLGCISCHQGMNIGGNMFQYFGVMDDYFERRGNITEADLGRYTVTKNPAHKYMFKVPSLRNVELTAPYFHDGSAKSLDQAVEVMAQVQLGRPITSEQVAKIVVFLKSLTGEYIEEGN